MEILQLIFLGLSVGLLSSFFGIGGGSLIVPVMFTLYHNLSPAVVVPISLGSIFIIAAGNIYKFKKLNLLPSKELTLNFFIFCSLGAFIGTQIVYLIDTKMAKLSMGIILFFMVIKLLFLTKIENNDNSHYLPKKLPFAFTGFFGAFLSSITGLGGGIIFTPVFANILKVPTRMVSPYSNLAMLVTTFIGVLPHFFIDLEAGDEVFKDAWISGLFIGHVNLGIILIISLAGFTTSILGVKLNSKVSAKTKNYLLCFLLSLFSAKLLFF